jgi:NAD(P)-dependent dehydrogenase (short-subunit alcohol dehydrogenase family)
MRDKVVAVTGGGRGIGKNIVRVFNELGAITVPIDRKADQFNTDLSHPYAGKLLIQEILDKHGRIDVLVNNARSHLRSKLFEETEEDWDHEMAVNLKSAYFLGKYAIQSMDGGAIVNVGSVTTNFVSHESAAYQISKGACLQLTRVLALAGAKKNVRVNCVLPGFIVQDEYRVRYEHEGNEAYRKAVEDCHPIGRPGTSDEVAHAVSYLAQAPFITGQSLTIDGGLTLLDIAAHTLRRP